MLMLLLTLQATVPTSPGIHDLTLAREHASEIVYSLSLPESFDANEPHALVVALHYAGRDRRHFGRGILTGLVEPGLRGLHAVIAAPDSPGGGWDGSDGERTVIALLDFLTERYRIDPDRIVITGYSMGGMGTWYIAARHSEKFTAAIPMAGAPRHVRDEELRALMAIPLYAIHSLADDVVPIGPTEDAVAKLRGWGAARVELAVVENVTHYDVAGFRDELTAAAEWLSNVWSAR